MTDDKKPEELLKSPEEESEVESRENFSLNASKEKIEQIKNSFEKTVSSARQELANSKDKLRAISETNFFGDALKIFKDFEENAYKVFNQASQEAMQALNAEVKNTYAKLSETGALGGGLELENHINACKALINELQTEQDKVNQKYNEVKRVYENERDGDKYMDIPGLDEEKLHEGDYPSDEQIVESKVSSVGSVEESVKVNENEELFKKGLENVQGPHELYELIRQIGPVEQGGKTYDPEDLVNRIHEVVLENKNLNSLPRISSLRDVVKLIRQKSLEVKDGVSSEDVDAKEDDTENIDFREHESIQSEDKKEIVGLEPRINQVIKVRRTSGDIEDDWIVSQVRGNIISVWKKNPDGEGNLVKGISISDFQELNEGDEIRMSNPNSSIDNAENSSVEHEIKKVKKEDFSFSKEDVLAAMEDGKNRLIKVKRSSGDIEDDWFIMGYVRGQALVVKYSETKEDPLYKIISAEELEELNKNDEENEHKTENISETSSGEIKLSPEDIALIEENLGIKMEDLKKIEGFGELSEGQQILAMENMKQLLLGKVISESDAQYKEDQKNRGFLKKVWGAFSKHKKVADIKKDKLSEMRNKNLMEGDREKDYENLLKQIVDVMRSSGPEVELVDGKTRMNFIGEQEGMTEEEKEAIKQFNIIASNFSKTSQDKSFGSKHDREVYSMRQARFEKALQEMLTLMASKGSEVEAMQRISEIDKSVRMTQYFNANPDVEDQIKNIKDGKWYKEALKGVVTERLLFSGGGYIARGATGAVLGFAAAPLVAASIGGLRAYQRGKGELSENDRLAREGVLDKSEQAKNIVSGDGLSQKLNRMFDDLETLQQDAETNQEKIDELLSRIMTRLDFTQEKIADGLVNYGEIDNRVSSEYSLVSAVAKAKVLVSENSPAVKEELEQRLENFLNLKEQKISSERRKFIFKKVRNGVIWSAGFAVVGAGIRELQGNFSGSREELADGVSSDKSGFKVPMRGGTPLVENGEFVYPEGFNPNVAEQTNTPPYTAFGEEAVKTAEEVTKNIPEEPYDSVFAREAEIDAVDSAGDRGFENDRDGIDASKVVTEAESKVEISNELLEKAMIRKGEGIEHALKRQLVDNPKVFGYKGDLGDAEAVKEWSGREAHRLAIKAGYVDLDTGQEVRVGSAGIGKVSYVIDTDPQRGAYVHEVYKDGGVVSEEGHYINSNNKFEGADKGNLEKYEYKHNPSSGPAEKVLDKENLENPHNDLDAKEALKKSIEDKIYNKGSFFRDQSEEWQYNKDLKASDVLEGKFRYPGRLENEGPPQYQYDYSKTEEMNEILKEEFLANPADKRDTFLGDRLDIAELTNRKELSSELQKVKNLIGPPKEGETVEQYLLRNQEALEGAGNSIQKSGDIGEVDLAEPTPEVAEPTPEVAEPTPEVTEPTPEVTEPTPEVAEPTPEVTEPTPEVTEPTPEVTEPTPEPSIYEPYAGLKDPEMEKSLYTLNQQSILRGAGNPVRDFQLINKTLGGDLSKNNEYFDKINKMNLRAIQNNEGDGVIIQFARDNNTFIHINNDGNIVAADLGGSGEWRPDAINKELNKDNLSDALKFIMESDSMKSEAATDGGVAAAAQEQGVLSSSTPNDGSVEQSADGVGSEQGVGGETSESSVQAKAEAVQSSVELSEGDLKIIRDQKAMLASLKEALIAHKQKEGGREGYAEFERMMNDRLARMETAITNMENGKGRIDVSGLNNFTPEELAKSEIEFVEQQSGLISQEELLRRFSKEESGTFDFAESEQMSNAAEAAKTVQESFGYNITKISPEAVVEMQKFGLVPGELGIVNNAGEIIINKNDIPKGLVDVSFSMDRERDGARDLLVSFSRGHDDVEPATYSIRDGKLVE